MAETLEQQVAWGSVIGIRIHRLMTGFLPDSDGNSTVLNVVIQPYDVDNEIVKVAGEITITVSAMNADGTPAVIGRTEVSLHDSRRHWSRALLSSGFHVPVEISAAGVSQWTSSNPLVVHAALQLAADRRYQATETIFDAARL